MERLFGRAARPRLDGLTGLRFMAALWVVFFHLRPLLMPNMPEPAAGIAALGFVGVGLFFTLSGFVIGYQYDGRDTRSRDGYVRFLIGRFARVYPLYALGLALAFPTLWADTVYTVSHGLRGVPHSVGILGSNILLLQAWTPWTACQWNCPGWSLSVEAFFYVLFPPIAVVAAALSTPCLLAGMAVLYALGLLAPYAYTYSGPVLAWFHEHPDRVVLVREAILYTPLLRLPEFMTGVLLARLFARGWRLPAPAGLAAAGALVAIGALWPQPRPDVFISNGLLTPLFAILILGVASGRDWLGRLLATRPMVLLGEASYAIYILHFILAAATAKTFAGSALPPAVVVPLYLGVTIAVSLAAVRLLEQPLRRRIEAALTRVYLRSEHGNHVMKNATGTLVPILCLCTALGAAVFGNARPAEAEPMKGLYQIRCQDAQTRQWSVVADRIRDPEIVDRPQAQGGGREVRGTGPDGKPVTVALPTDRTCMVSTQSPS